MTRIIAGTAGGRRIAVPRGDGTRPTSDRVREALFSSIIAELGSLEGLGILDLYAGSGALGLEALSRGAARALLVESDRNAAATIRRNIDTLGLAGAELVQSRVEAVLVRQPRGGRYDVLLADPPYSRADSEIESVLNLATEWLLPNALLVVERSSRAGAVPWPAGFHSVRARRYGDTMLWYGRAAV
ncbi:16S rRNA (guanine(966)-N(2))-methyltransferase RsmD [Lipingzhangella sp. LS1_29]|uniref:16S rRNA (Guanine(966)-N(2))-methyltransferase RsmD n=1 Tax=Lipingzhangella rawalii TaxID=2055835 RepID=A0ABU2H5Q7_9ACTN|nr:16S rRNA (guanine(966)-N(2))-methyltransferase RsmD [Lipingzhangella rawalii]MDS1270644.1 16S rRNA (guanine(966)-N(2))-methyltransferase RsmD [Lipingzhangella rawalii]